MSLIPNPTELAQDVKFSEKPKIHTTYSQNLTKPQ